MGMMDLIWDKLTDVDWGETAPYVDTLLVPVININLTSKAQFNNQRHHSLHVAAEVERQLTGRVMLMPPIAYITNEAWFQSYVTNIRRRAANGEFAHVFFLIDETVLEQTQDIDWGHRLKVADSSSSVEDARAEIRNLCEQLVQKWQEEV